MDDVNGEGSEETTNVSDGGQASAGGVQPSGGGDRISMTPAQLNERLERARAKAAEPYADYDDLKAAAERLAELEQQELSERERLEKKVADLEQGLTDARAKREALELEHAEALLMAEVRRQATAMGFLKPREAELLADLGDVDPEEREKGVEKALKALAKSSPHLVGADSGGGSPPNRPGRVSGREVDEALVDEAATKYGIRVPKKGG